MNIFNTKRIKNIILYPATMIFICFVLLEFSMIILEPYLFSGFYQYDPDLGFRVRPHARGTNRFGFNDRDYPLQKDSNTFRILVVGDSFNWAGGKQKNYTTMLEKQFEKYYGGHQVDVINAGYPMTHTAEQLEMLKKYGLQYNPDLVFLGFFIGNDFIDADPNRKRIVVNDVYFDIDKRKELTLLGYPIVQKSRLLHFVKQKYIVFRESIKSRNDAKTKTDSVVKEERGTFSIDTFLQIARNRLEFFNLEKHQAQKYHEQINYIFQSIDEMKKLLDSRNIKFVVGIYPDEFQVNEYLLNQIFSKFNLERENYDIELGQKLLKQHLDFKQIQYIDMLKEFRVEGKRRQLYLLRDTHWNDSGNELAAKLIFKNLLGFVNVERALKSTQLDTILSRLRVINGTESMAKKVEALQPGHVILKKDLLKGINHRRVSSLHEQQSAVKSNRWQLLGL